MKTMFGGNYGFCKQCLSSVSLVVFATCIVYFRSATRNVGDLRLSRFANNTGASTRKRPATPASHIRKPATLLAANLGSVNMASWTSHVDIMNIRDQCTMRHISTHDMQPILWYFVVCCFMAWVLDKGVALIRCPDTDPDLPCTTSFANTHGAPEGVRHDDLCVLGVVDSPILIGSHYEL